MTDKPHHMTDTTRQVEDWQTATEQFQFGVGEGSHIDRVPVTVKVRIQTSVSDQPQESNSRLRSGGRGLGVKFATLKPCLIATYMRLRGIRGLFYYCKFIKEYINSR